MHCTLKFQPQILNFSFSQLLLLILQNAAGTDVFMQMKLLGTKLSRRVHDPHIL